MEEMQPQVVEYLLNNTVMDGGGTVLDPLHKANVPLTGYVVGIGGMTCDKESLNPKMFRGMMAYFAEEHGHLTCDDDMGIGTWLCNVCGEVHVDLVKWVKHEHQAKHLAFMHDQIAYYDVTRRTNVYMKPQRNGGCPQPEAEDEDDLTDGLV